MPEFFYQNPLPVTKDETEYYKIPGSEQYVTVDNFAGEEVLRVCPEALTILANAAMKDVSFLLRKEHNEQVAKILTDPEASRNDKGVAMAFLRNAMVSAQFELPTCQDTGTALLPFLSPRSLMNPSRLLSIPPISNGIHSGQVEQGVKM